MSSERSKLERKRLSERAEARRRRRPDEGESPDVRAERIAAELERSLADLLPAADLRAGASGGVPLGEELPGEVWYVPDTWWGFGVAVRDSHPGACVAFDDRARRASLLRGLTPTDKALRLAGSHVLVRASRDNGLQHETMFPLQPWWFGESRVRCLYPERRVGRLDPDDLERLQRALYRIFCAPDESRGGGR